MLVSALGGIDPALHGDTVRAIASEFENSQSATRRVDRSLNEANTYYIVHDGDLNLLRDAATVAVALFPLFKPFTALPVLITYTVQALTEQLTLPDRARRSARPRSSRKSRRGSERRGRTCRRGNPTALSAAGARAQPVVK